MIEEEEPQFWEPWQPRVGQRVRILSRPECHYCREDHDVEVGATGVLEEITEPLYDTGLDSRAHRYWVRFDDPSVWKRSVARVPVSHFAAIELEPA